eukprot:CAMPEP_0167796782 /NCGR_PEP_ID=MMETSP0111_2-20121227/15254_1 /TAXON_ID=91324 /ORGANISM="Lotharella globosa, Strain CCCM811" /LENGTH=259 /DNA_ID=CAMNT_0007690743 /DNA_START=33 /DNA_END=809 /DNA_ORIENTATION=-
MEEGSIYAAFEPIRGALRRVTRSVSAPMPHTCHASESKTTTHPKHGPKATKGMARSSSVGGGGLFAAEVHTEKDLLTFVCKAVESKESEWETIKAGLISDYLDSVQIIGLALAMHKTFGVNAKHTESIMEITLEDLYQILAMHCRRQAQVTGLADWSQACAQLPRSRHAAGSVVICDTHEGDEPPGKPVLTHTSWDGRVFSIDIVLGEEEDEVEEEEKEEEGKQEKQHDSGMKKEENRHHHKRSSSHATKSRTSRSTKS